MESREEYCKKLSERIFTPALQSLLVQLLNRAVAREQQATALLTGSLRKRAFGQGLVYAIHAAFKHYINNRLFPLPITENPSSDNRAFPSYVLGASKTSIAIQPYRLKEREFFPKRAIYRDYNINTSQALLFSLEELRVLGHDISTAPLSRHTFAFLLYRANADMGLTMASIGFPLSTDEGSGWVIPLIDILNTPIIVDTDNYVEYAKPILRPGIIRKPGINHQWSRGGA